MGLLFLEKEESWTPTIKIQVRTLCIERLLFYPLHHGGLFKDYLYSPEIILCSMLTNNDECIRVYK